MPHIVLPQCINCKYGDCVEVCPVDCFHEGENMVAINPEECIDCGVCIAACPVNAIVEHEADNEIHNRWLKINTEAVVKYKWPQIIDNKPKVCANADDYAEMLSEKKEKMFSSKPGKI